MKKKSGFSKIIKRITLTTIFLSSLFLWQNDISAQGETKELPTRDKIEVQYKWNLKDVYKSVKDWENDFIWVKNSITKFKNFESKLSESSHQSRINYLNA